jgi:hypothetical protein
MNTVVLDGIEELQDLYDSLEEDFRDISYVKWMHDELDRMTVLHQGYFNNSSGPDGVAWKPNAPSTIRQKGHAVVLRGKTRYRVQGKRKKRWKNIAKKSQFRLKRSLTLNAKKAMGDAIRDAIDTDNGAYLQFGTAVEYSAYNQDRPHVGINEQHLDGMVERVADYTLKILAE